MTAAPTPVKPTVKLMPLAGIRPYWRNPRVISPDAIAGVKASIERFGFRNPIIVDSDHVIITGHTRYAAAQAAELAKVPVIIAADMTAEDAAAYRLVDNKTAELTSWSDNDLLLELRAADDNLHATWFDNISLEETLGRIATETSDEAVESAFAKVNTQRLTPPPNADGSPGDPTGPDVVTVNCPHCLQSFGIDRASLGMV